MLIQPSRRRFLLGAVASLLAAPAIVRAASLMDVRPEPQATLYRWIGGPLPAAPATGETLFFTIQIKRPGQIEWRTMTDEEFDGSENANLPAWTPSVLLARA